jgi:hypothetical protein
MSRHPFSRDWRLVVGLLIAALVVFGAFLGFRSYLLALGALLVTIIGTGIYLTGESSDLPGTSGDHDKNVPT